MINKENQNKKIEDSKKESRRQTKKETEGERESKGYAKTEKEQDLKRLKQRHICFIQRIDNNTGKKEENNRIEVSTIHLSWRDILK